MDKKKRLRKEADKLWYQVYLKEYCEICGDSYVLQAHHFYYKGSYQHLRYDKDNHITLCKGCHFVLHHQDPKKITDQIIEIRGQKWYSNLKRKALERPQSYLTLKYYQDVAEDLKTFLAGK